MKKYNTKYLKPTNTYALRRDYLYDFLSHLTLTLTLTPPALGFWRHPVRVLPELC
jgi:hypothetical protein